MKLNSSGQVSRLLLVLAIIILVAVIIVYFVMRLAEKPATPAPATTQTTVPQPVYEQTLGSIRFVFEDARDLGNTLRASQSSSPQYQKDITISERFILVAIGAQNMGKTNIPERAWDLGNIVDSDGRIFNADDSYTVGAWLPAINLCGALLKPAFQPSPCTKIYEVSRVSKGLKIMVSTGKNNDPSNFSSGKLDQAAIDLILK